MQNLVVRKGIFYYRQRIPCDLIDLLGRKEVQRSLRCRDHKAAKQLTKTIKSNLDAAFITLRHQMILDMDPDVIKATMRDIVECRLPCNRKGAVLSMRYLSRVSNDREDEEGVIGRILVQQLFTTYCSDKATSWTPKTTTMHKAAMRLFDDIVGIEQIDKINRKHCRNFRDTIAQLPANMTKKYPNATVAEVLKLKPTPMSITSVNKYLSFMSSFFNWCVDEGHITDNPMKGLKLPNNRRLDLERSIFGNVDLMRLFVQSPLYSGCKSPSHRHDKGDIIIKDSKYWLPLIGLYTGMRLEEIAQLHTTDIKQQDGIWVFDVNLRDEKTLKNQHSQRLIPIHSSLIKLGLLEYHQDSQKQGLERLWPDLERTALGNYSAYFSKWFGRHKKRIGITDPKVTFHSLRHTFINALKQNGTSETTIKELVGHKEESITMGRYGKRYELETLRVSIETLPFDKLLGHTQ